MKKLLLIALAFFCLHIVTAQETKKKTKMDKRVEKAMAKAKAGKVTYAQKVLDKKINSKEANERIQNLKERILVVVTSKSNEDFNTDFKNAIQTEYHYENAGIVYMTEKELNKLSKKELKKHAVLTRYKQLSGFSMGYDSRLGRERNMNDKTAHYFLMIKLAEDKSTDNIWMANLTSKFPNKEEINKSVKQINWILDLKKDGKDIGPKAIQN